MIEALQKGHVRPQPDRDSRWWWTALGEGRLELPRCRDCRETFFPPQPSCPHCGSTSWERIQGSGRGRIYSWVVAHTPFDPAFAEDVPYAVLAVELEEGVRLFGRYGGPLESIEAGAPVLAVIYRVQGEPLLGFEPAGSGERR